MSLRSEKWPYSDVLTDFSVGPVYADSSLAGFSNSQTPEFEESLNWQSNSVDVISDDSAVEISIEDDSNTESSECSPGVTDTESDTESDFVRVRKVIPTKKTDLDDEEFTREFNRIMMESVESHRHDVRRSNALENASSRQFLFGAGSCWREGRGQFVLRLFGHRSQDHLQQRRHIRGFQSSTEGW